MNPSGYNPLRPAIRLPFWLVLALMAMLLSACGDQTIDVRAPAPELRPTSLMPISIAEDAPADSVLRTLKIQNAERYTSEGLSFQFASGADSTPFALARSSGELRLEGTLDYEHKNSYTLPLRVNYRQVYTLYDLVVEITDVYEPLRVIEQVIQEPVAVAASDTTLVDLSAMVQRQAGEALTYSILSGNELGLFAIDASGQLHLVASMPSSFAHSTSSGIELRIQVVSVSGQVEFPLRLVPASSVYFVDQNQIALDEALSWSAQENQPAGTQLGQVYARLTQGANAEVVYALDHPLFVIDARTGVVRSTAPLNFEQATNTYDLQIQAQAGSLNAELSVRVSVSDANDLPAPPQPTTPLNAGDNLCQSAEETASLSHEINEDSTAATELLTLSTTDEDGDTLSYILNQPGGTELFALNRETGVLSLIAPLDAETISCHILGIAARDEQGIGQSTRLIIAVGNINEPPQWVVPEITVPEDSAPQTVLADLGTATDPEGSPLSYQIVSGGDSELFAINAAAELVLNAALDYESASTHRIQVRISDLSALNTVVDIDIAVTNINEPPQPDQLPLSFEVVENSALNTEVGQPAFTDPESDAFTWSIPTENIPISINPNTGALLLSAAVDAESQSEYSFQIRVEDSDGAFALYPATLRISDINEAPVPGSPTTTADTAILFGHSLGVGAIVATLAVSDPEDDTLSYSLTSGNEQGLFAIDDTGFITMAQIVNLDTVGMDYQTALAIQISDGTLSVTTTVHLAIEVSDTSAPGLGQTREFSVDENSAAPATIANLEIKDHGLEPVTVSFSPQQSQSIEAFAISPAGQLTLIQALDHEEATSHRLTVRLTNSQTQSADYLVVVAVNDIDEAPVFADNLQTTVHISAGQIIDRVVASFPATDPEEGTITYSISSGNDDARFSINAQTGVLRLVTAFSEQILTADLGILASDTGGNHTSLSVSIRISTNSAPVFALASTTFMIDENGPVNQLLTQLSATDTENDTLSYRLVGSDETGSNTNARSQAFFEVMSDGQVIVTTPLNYEAIPRHALTVAVSDGTDETTQDITVAVRDINDLPVITSGLHNTGSLPENIGFSAVIRTLEFSDEDGSFIRWFVIRQQDSEGNSIPREEFDVDFYDPILQVRDNKIRLQGQSRLDFERYPSITLTVEGLDLRRGRVKGSFTFRVLDVNEAPELLRLNRQYGVAENEPIGTVISEDLIAEDPEGDQARVDILLGNEEGQFNFDPSIGRLSSAQMFDRDQNDSHSLLLQASEVCKDPPLCELELLSTHRQTTVCVLDVNEAPTFHIDNTITVSSQAQVGSIINRSIAARDPEDQPIELRVVSGDNAVFGIDAERGGIELRQPLTADQNYSLEIQACDVPGPAPTVAGPCARLQRVSPYNPSCSTIQSVQINTTDDDIQPPAVAADVLISQEEQNFTITWNNPGDTDYSHTILRWQDSAGTTTERRFDRAPRSPGASKDNLWAPHLEEPALNFGTGLHRFEMITVDNPGNPSEPIALRVRMVEPVVLPIVLENNTPLVDLHIYDAALDGADSIDNYTYTIVAGNDSYTYNPTRTKTETHYRFRIRTVADNDKPGSFAQRCPFGWLCTHKALANYYDPQDMPETISDSVADNRNYTFSRTRPDHVSVRLEHRHYSHDIQITVLPDPRAIAINQQCENFADLSRLDRWLCINGREIIPEGMSRRPTDAELCALPENIRTLWGNDRNNYQLVVSADFNDIEEVHKMFYVAVSGGGDYWQNTPYPLHEVKDGAWIQRSDPIVGVNPDLFGRMYLTGSFLDSSSKFEFSSGYLEVRQLADIPVISAVGPFFIMWSRYGFGHDSFNSLPDVSIFDEELVNESGARVDLGASNPPYFLPRSVLGKVGYLEIDFWERWTLGQRGPLWVIHSYPYHRNTEYLTTRHQQRYTIPGNRAWGNKRYFYNLPSTGPFITGLEIDPDSDDGFDAIRFYRRILQESSTTEVPPGILGSVANKHASFKDAVSHTAPLTIEWTNFRIRDAGFNAPCHAEFYIKDSVERQRCADPLRLVQPNEIQWRFDYIRLWKRRDAALPSFLRDTSAPAPAPDPFACPG